MILKLMCFWLVLFNIIIDDVRNHKRKISAGVLVDKEFKSFIFRRIPTAYVYVSHGFNLKYFT
jgi:hypothetical protein